MTKELTKIALCLPLIFAVFNLGFFCKTWIQNMFRNPEATEKSNVPALVCLGLMEATILIILSFIYII